LWTGEGQAEEIEVWCDIIRAMGKAGIGWCGWNFKYGNQRTTGRNIQGVQGAHLNPLGLFLTHLGLFLRTSTPFIWRVLSAFSPAWTPCVAERTCSPQAHDLSHWARRQQVQHIRHG
jgi:hypothetical protein